MLGPIYIQNKMRFIPVYNLSPGENNWFKGTKTIWEVFKTWNLHAANIEIDVF